MTPRSGTCENKLQDNPWRRATGKCNQMNQMNAPFLCISDGEVPHEAIKNESFNTLSNGSCRVNIHTRQRQLPQIDGNEEHHANAPYLACR